MVPQAALRVAVPVAGKGEDKMNNFLFAVLMMCSSLMLRAQYVEDAVRILKDDHQATPRTGALGVAYHGILDDIATLSYNPAGLALLGNKEFSVSFGFERVNTQTDYFGVIQDFGTNTGYINHIGIAGPVNSQKNNVALGVMYFREAGYNNYYNFDIFNTQSSAVLDQAKYGPGNFDDNWAYQLYLADDQLITPIDDSLRQINFVQEDGGLHNITGGISLDLNDNMAIGFALTGKWGSYEYSRFYREIDVLNIYTADNLEFDNLEIREDYEQSISGVTGSIGFLAKIENFMRIGMNIKLPTFYNITENFSSSIDATFDFPDEDGYSTYFIDNSGDNDYDIVSPFIYSVGLSIHQFGLTLAAGFEYKDATQLEFNDAIYEVMILNQDIIRDLTGQMNVGGAIEYMIPKAPIVLRGSYSLETTPYKDKIEGGDLKTYGFGAGIFIGEKVRLDLMGRIAESSHLRVNYGFEEDIETYAPYTFKLAPMTITLGFTYRN